MRPISLLFLAPLLVAALLGAVPAAAQQLQGRVTESQTLQPVVGAQVTLLDETDEAVAAAVTDALGGFRLTAPGPGEYRVRAERVGLRATLTRTLALAPGEAVQVEVRMSPAPVELHSAVAAAPPRTGVSGQVLDDQTGEPVPGVTVTLLSARELRAGRTVTDSSGWFHLRVPGPDGYQLRVERAGYQAASSAMMTLNPDDSVQVQMRVSARSVLLAPLTVVSGPSRLATDVRLASFEWRRRRQTFGRFLGPEELERIKPFYASDALLQVPMVQTAPVPGSRFDRTITLPARGRGTAARTRCVPNVYVDGRRTPLTEGLTLDQLVVGSSLAAVEVYASPNGAPGEFPPLDDPMCGVVVVWTRS